MTARRPVVIGADGQFQQLQAGDSLLASAPAFYVASTSTQAGPTSTAPGVWTTLLPAPTAKTSKIIPAGQLLDGDAAGIDGIGAFATPLNPGDLKVRLRLGGLELFNITISNVVVSATGPCIFHANVYQRASTLLATGYILFAPQGGMANLYGLNHDGTEVATNSSAIDRLLEIDAQWQASTAAYVKVTSAEGRVRKGG